MCTFGPLASYGFPIAFSIEKEKDFVSFSFVLWPDERYTFLPLFLMPLITNKLKQTYLQNRGSLTLKVAGAIAQVHVAHAGHTAVNTRSVHLLLIIKKKLLIEPRGTHKHAEAYLSALRFLWRTIIM